MVYEHSVQKQAGLSTLPALQHSKWLWLLDQVLAGTLDEMRTRFPYYKSCVLITGTLIPLDVHVSTPTSLRPLKCQSSSGADEGIDKLKVKVTCKHILNKISHTNLNSCLFLWVSLHILLSSKSLLKMKKKIMKTEPGVFNYIFNFLSSPLSLTLLIINKFYFPILKLKEKGLNSPLPRLQWTYTRDDFGPILSFCNADL